LKFVAEFAALEPPLKAPKYCEFTDPQVELYKKSLMVTTDIGVVVDGTTAKFVVTPVEVLVIRKAKASEN
jgi:hypothetical protein